MNAARRQAALFPRSAQRDQRAFALVLNASSGEDFPVAAFPAQQAVGKSFKAAPGLAGRGYDPTHDLEVLAHQELASDLALPVSMEDLPRLTPCAVAFRHDDTLMPLLTPARASAVVDACVSWCESLLASS